MSLPAHLLPPAGWPPELSLRLAAAADEAALHTTLYTDRSAAAFAQHFQQSLRQQAQDRSFWLVVTGDRPVIAAVQLLRLGETMEIANLAVGADRRGQGLGTRLIAAAAGIAAHFGDQVLEINVATDNRRALALYRRLGFQRRRLFYVPDGTWAVRLQRPVSEWRGETGSE